MISQSRGFQYIPVAVSGLYGACQGRTPMRELFFQDDTVSVFRFVVECLIVLKAAAPACISPMWLEPT